MEYSQLVTAQKDAIPAAGILAGEYASNHNGQESYLACILRFPRLPENGLKTLNTATRLCKNNNNRHHNRSIPPSATTPSSQAHLPPNMPRRSGQPANAPPPILTTLPTERHPTFDEQLGAARYVINHFDLYRDRGAEPQRELWDGLREFLRATYGLTLADPKAMIDRLTARQRAQTEWEAKQRRPVAVHIDELVDAMTLIAEMANDMETLEREEADPVFRHQLDKERRALSARMKEKRAILAEPYPGDEVMAARKKARTNYYIPDDTPSRPQEVQGQQQPQPEPQPQTQPPPQAQPQAQPHPPPAAQPPTANTTTEEDVRRASHQIAQNQASIEENQAIVEQNQAAIEQGRPTVESRCATLEKSQATIEQNHRRLEERLDRLQASQDEILQTLRSVRDAIAKGNAAS